MKELYTVFTQYRAGSLCIDQYFATNMAEIEEKIIKNLTSLANEGLNEEEKQLVKMDNIYQRHHLRLICNEGTINTWRFNAGLNIEINVVKTSQVVTEDWNR